MGKHIGPGYIRAGPITAGPLGVGCLIPILVTVIISLTIGVAL